MGLKTIFRAVDSRRKRDRMTLTNVEGWCQLTLNTALSRTATSGER